MLLTVLFYFFIAVILIQLTYYSFFIIASSHKSQSKKTELNPVSVIISARNEAENLQNNLKHFLEQQYDHFEVIIANDGSSDNTLSVLLDHQKNYKNLKIVNIANTQGNKKNAITKAIESSSNEILLFSDADCKPISKNWISEVVSHLNTNKKIVLGYGAYQKIHGSFLNKLIRYETLLTAIQYFSYANIGIPYMGVGRNLAYTKSVFKKADGFSDHANIKSGDDDLFINTTATKENTSICISKNSFTISIPKISLKSWFQQKRRHITTATYYKNIHKILLGLFYISQFLFWLLAIILLVFSFNWQLILILMITRFIFQYLSYGNLAKSLNEKDLILVFPLLDITLVLCQIILFLNNLISKPNSW